jgi:hypothetical protein
VDALIGRVDSVVAPADEDLVGQDPSRAAVRSETSKAPLETFGRPGGFEVG